MLPNNISECFDTIEDFNMVCCIQEALENFSQKYKIDYVKTIKIFERSFELKKTKLKEIVSLQ